MLVQDYSDRFVAPNFTRKTLAHVYGFYKSASSSILQAAADGQECR